MRKIILLTLLFLIGIQSICLSSKTPPSKFQWIESTSERSVFFDTESLTYSKDSNGQIKIIDAWLYMCFDESYAQKLLQDRKNKNLSTTEFDGLSFSLWHTNFDNEEQKVKLLSVSNFDKDDAAIGSHSYPNAAWHQIKPNTYFEIWCKKISEYIQNKSNNQ
ncbi:MAG: hypothetical protein H6Q69_287 [Firmicutes bacterium]|nr:hypothetical protein [Bacillota bacterium]